MPGALTVSSAVARYDDRMIVTLLLLVGCFDERPAEPITEAGAESTSEATPAVDVLLVVLDTVRADAVGAYGYERDTTPHFDRLASRGVLFEDVTVSGTWSWPSHASMFTGEPPWVHGAHFAAGEDSDAYEADNGDATITAMRADLPTLAERFTDAGYRSVCVTGNHWLKRGVGLDRGFEEVLFAEQGERVTDHAREVILSEDPRPLFLVVNLFDVHAPYEIRGASWLRGRPDLTHAGAPGWLTPYLTEDGRKLNLYQGDGEANGMVAFSRGELAIPAEGLALLRDVYDGEVWHIDQLLGRVLKQWRGRSRRVVAVTSDHGEYLGERGRLDHGRSVYPEVSAVPLVVAAEGFGGGERVATPVQLEAIPDTLLELAGLAGGPRSLVAVAAGGAGPASIQSASWADALWAREIGAPHHLGERLYRVGDEAVVIRGDKLSYYRLAEDPGMTRDARAAFPERAAALAAEAEEAFPEAAAERLELTDADASALRALGYLE